MKNLPIIVRLSIHTGFKKHYFSVSERIGVVNIKIKKGVIILTIIILPIIVALVIINQKTRTDNEEKVMYLSLLQAENAFNLDLHLEKDTHKGLSKVDNLNTLLEPTNVTNDILTRWKIVHKVDPEYPYPEDEIEADDWMGMNDFLHEEENKSEMTYDENNNIDSDVFDFILSEAPSDHPVVEEAIRQMNREE